MTLWGEDQLSNVRDEALFQVRVELVLVELPVLVCAALMQERMGA